MTSNEQILARLAVARGLASRVSNQLDEAMELFLLPDEDARGFERGEIIDGVLEDSGRLSRVMEKIQTLFANFDPAQPSLEEEDDAVEEEEARDEAG